MAQDARKREVQIKWLKLKMCGQANDSYRLPENYVGKISPSHGEKKYSTKVKPIAEPLLGIKLTIDRSE